MTAILAQLAEIGLGVSAALWGTFRLGRAAERYLHRQRIIEARLRDAKGPRESLDQNPDHDDETCDDED